MSDPSENLADVRAALAAAAQRAGREGEPITLVAVSKTHGPERILRVLEAGQRIFGENKVQEAAGKWPGLRENRADIELHLIGPLQTNKVRDAVRVFDVIETVDREKLARKLMLEMQAQDRMLPVYIQVNIGEEPQKTGVAPDQVDGFVRLCRDEIGLDVRGLMAIPPAGSDPAPWFTELARLARNNALPVLSMGMSADYEVAVALGATHIRVGTAIFGTRQIPI